MVSLLRAQEVMEQKFTSARNESISNSIKIADSTSELAKQGRTESINANLKATSLNNEYKQDESIHVEKLVAEKSKAIDQIETDLAIVSQASERLKANAESFVNSGKDAWNNHYEKTEVELREKSDASSNHVQGNFYGNSCIKYKKTQYSFENILPCTFSVFQISNLVLRKPAPQFCRLNRIWTQC